MAGVYSHPQSRGGVRPASPQLTLQLSMRSPDPLSSLLYPPPPSGAATVSRLGFPELTEASGHCREAPLPGAAFPTGGKPLPALHFPRPLSSSAPSFGPYCSPERSLINVLCANRPPRICLQEPSLQQGLVVSTKILVIGIWRLPRVWRARLESHTAGITTRLPRMLWANSPLPLWLGPWAGHEISAMLSPD